jgi:soluble lytic murein transglycosylase
MATRHAWTRAPRILILVALSALAQAQDVAPLARLYALNSTPANRAALLQYANSRSGAEGGLALLAVAAADVRAGRAADALPLLRAAQPRLPKLADFVSYLLASSCLALSDFASAATAAEVVVASNPPSPMTGPAAVIGAKAYLGAGNPGRAIQLLLRVYKEAAQPDADALLASAYESSGDAANAVIVYQRIWVTYPSSDEAQDAEAALPRLRLKLGAAYVAPAQGALLARAGKLMEARDYVRARAAYEELSRLAIGAMRDLAAVRIGSADYRSRKDTSAIGYLQALRVSDAEADAERLNLIAAAARRLKQPDTVAAALSDLAREHPRSDWRLQALVSAGNEYWIERPDEADTYFTECYTDFGDSPQAPECHWRASFRAYLANRPGWQDLFTQHIMRYPESEKGSAALYFLGRAAERASRPGDARAYYQEVERRYPNYYYAVLARGRLSDPTVAKAAPSRSVSGILSEANAPRRISAAHFAPSADTRVRFDRARLLASAAADDLSTAELRFGARVGSQPEAYGLELARLAAQRSAPEQGVRFLKKYSPGYLFASIESLPDEFWRLSFPIPYRNDLERFSEANGLDPFTVAALIRQESEWDRRAISRARAYGLMQVLPSTGRDLSRRVGLAGFRPNMLFEPQYNLQLGAYYLKRLLDAFGGQWEPALAAYNAGKSRADAWMARLAYREPAEFVEQIPFSETRNYIQIVIRNADIYRRLYGAAVRN